MKLRVKEICKSKGISITQLAQMMDIRQESLSRAINGNPNITTIENIATALGVEITELFEQSAKDGSATCPHCGKPISIKLE